MIVLLLYFFKKLARFALNLEILALIIIMSDHFLKIKLFVSCLFASKHAFVRFYIFTFVLKMVLDATIRATCVVIAAVDKSQIFNDLA